jgi:hypothetical protein
VGGGIVTAKQVVDLARLALRQDGRTAQFDGELVLLRLEQLQGAGELVVQLPPRFRRRRLPLLDEGIEVGLAAIFRPPEGRALGSAAGELFGQAGNDGIRGDSGRLMRTTDDCHNGQKDEQTFHNQVISFL